MIQKFTDLDVYTLAYKLAMEIFEITKSYPTSEKYSLTDQINRSSRSVCANIAEGWGKRVYVADFKRHLIYAIGSLQETKTWIQFSFDCKYITTDTHTQLLNTADDIGAKLYLLHKNWK